MNQSTRNAPMDDNTLYDVAVIGFGPSGAVAAALLGQAGLRTFVCDRTHEVYAKPRAIALDHEILRVFQQLGVADEILQHAEPFTDSLYYGVDGQLIKRMSTVPQPYPMAHPPSAVFTQPPVEAILRQRVSEMPAVTIALGLALDTLQQDQDAVQLGLRGDDGATQQVRARYVIGCDGATSTVRALADIPLEDLSFDEPWLVVDVLVNEQGLAKLPQTSVQYCEPERPCTFVIGPKNHRRWEIAINPGEDPAYMATPEGTWSVLKRWLTPDDAQLWRQASYRFHALVASEWRRDRVFIAGDAAHQQPPFLGQGMCQGVRDVSNLAWKLTAVLQGRAADTLLDTYGVERKRHVEQLTGRIKGIGAVICERDVLKARQRDAALLAACGGVVKPEPRQSVQPALDTGCLSAREHPARGTLFPQPWVMHQGQRVRLDSVVGCGWWLVLSATAPMPLVPAELIERLQLTTLRFDPASVQELDSVVNDWLQAHHGIGAIVRPDHYVYGVAANADSLIQQIAQLSLSIPSPNTYHPTTSQC